MTVDIFLNEIGTHQEKNKKSDTEVQAQYYGIDFPIKMNNATCNEDETGSEKGYFKRLFLQLGNFHTQRYNLALNHKLVSYTFDSFYIVFAYFFPQFSDMNINGPATYNNILPPNGFQNDLAIENFIRYTG